jgi:hypothetical protein
MLNLCELKCRLIFLLKPVVKVFFGIYINTVTHNWLSLNYIKFGSVFKPSFKTIFIKKLPYSLKHGAT